MQTIELICFPGAPNLPIFVAKEKGFFDQAGVAINMTTTPSSAFQAENLINGKFHIAGTAFDNVVAYQEGQGAVKFDRQPDLFAFMGATQVELAFIVAPEIATYQDVKGKSLALDAVATGFAFVLYEMLAKAGLQRGDYSFAAVGATPQRWEAVRAGQHVGTITIEPFTSIAKSQGFRVLDTVEQRVPGLSGRLVRREPRLGGGQSRRAQGLHQGLSRRPRVDAQAGEPPGGDRHAAAQHAGDQAAGRRRGHEQPAVAEVRPDARGGDPDGRRARGARPAHALRLRARPRSPIRRNTST